ncbi:MAG: hypothetical protein P8M30_13875, partial [Planctomycetaceae bacterium]|nr:hypothetical protein [Planctomycetaceae bacterium]
MAIIQSERSPLLKPASMFLIALSLSIGWGIRGNFGHEAGAMIAGALSAMAVALVSGREDWRERVMYFGFFGGLGWGFGGSIAYMYPLSFTESGHTATTYYGYFCTFFEGGLWCGMGAAGTAFAACMPMKRLTRFFTPLCFVMAALGLRHYIEEPLAVFLAPTGGETGDGTWHRHKSPLYWFDADWLQALMALIGVCIYDLYDRLYQERRKLLDNPVMLIPFAVGGAALGYGVQTILASNGLDVVVRDALTVPLGDLSYVNPETGGQFAPDQLLTNWPQFFGDVAQHLGWGFGLFVGATVYFLLTGRFRNDSSLLLALSLGWLIAFVAMPTLGSLFLMEYGGFRVMPPRSDDWAGIVGVFAGGLLWFRSHQLASVAHVMTRAFILGGISFASVPMIRYFVRYPGHPWRFDGVAPEGWVHYQSANWHSILEQAHGFGHGLAIAIVMAMLWKREPLEESQRNDRRWTIGFSAAFVLFGFGFLNLHKLVHTWIKNKSVPETLKAPFLAYIDLSPNTWFRIVWYLATAVGAILLLVHLRRRLDIIPASWIGKGQLLYVLFLWLMVIGNLMRAIPGFSDGRMVTEWMLFMNACIATLLGVLLPRPSAPEPVAQNCLKW